MSKTLDHAHKLKRHTYKNKSTVYHCVLPDCYFKIEPGLAEGKRMICWRCNKEFIANQYTITLAKPHCEECHEYRHQQVGRKQYKGKPSSAQPVPEPVAITNLIADESITSLKDRLSGVSSVQHVTMVLEDEDL